MGILDIFNAFIAKILIWSGWYLKSFIATRPSIVDRTTCHQEPIETDIHSVLSSGRVSGSEHSY